MRSPDFLLARRPGRALLEIRFALAIGATAAERGAFCKNLAVVLVVAARPVAIAARMFLPGGSLARTIEFGTVLTAFAGPVEFRPLAKWAIALRAILARTRKSRTLLAAAVLARLIEAWFVITAGRTGIPPDMIGGRSIALLPRFRLAAIPRGALAIPAAKILAWSAVRRTARGKLLVAAEFPLRPIPTRPIAIARRARRIRAICSRAVAVLAETFAPRSIGPLRSAAFARRVGLLVAEFPVLKTGGRAGLITVEIRAVAARGIGALFAAVLAAGAVFAVEARRTGRVIPVTAGRCAVAFAGVSLAAARMRLLVIRSAALGLAGRGALLALALGRKTALGELLLGSARGAGAAFAASRPVTPAAGIVVFVVIAGHE